LVGGEAFYGKDFDGADVAPFVGSNNTFLNLPAVKTPEELKRINPDVVIIGEPFDFGTTIRPGARYGPRAIRAASTIPSPPIQRFNIETGIDPFETFGVVDYGDTHVVPGDIIKSHQNMTLKVKEALEADGIPVMLGGDHSITYANVRAFQKKFKNIGMIHFDTHADCAPQGLTGFKYDHGAHIRRIMEMGCLKGKNYSLVGPRGYWPGRDLYKWMADQDFQWYTMLDVEELGIDLIAKDIADRANDGTDAVYLSWDIDSFDPSVAPGTGEPEPNGLTAREGMRMVRQLSKSFDPDRFAMDLVEIAPAYDVSDNSSYNGGITSGLGQRLVIELLAGLSLTKRGLKEGDPVRPNDYNGKGHTLGYGNPEYKIPKRD